MKAALYVRCSTDEQNHAMQVEDLRRLCALRGWTVAGEYIDQGISGAARKRPALDRMLADAAKRKFDIVAVWRFDRAARSVAHLIQILEQLCALSIDFVSHQESVDTSTPMGKCMFTIIGAFAELERAVIRERVTAGLAHARQNGTRSGQAIGRPRKVFRIDLATSLRESGASWREIAMELRVPESTLRERMKDVGV